jgi:hypothetical protein
VLAVLWIEQWAVIVLVRDGKITGMMEKTVTEC